MKTLNVLFIPFVLLTLSGCYNPAYFQDQQYWSPSPPSPMPPSPPDPEPPGEPIPSPSLPVAPPNPTHPAEPPHRDSGNQRKGTNDNAQDNSRNSGAQRNADNANSHQAVQDNSHSTIPARGNNPTRENPVSGQRGGR